MITQGIRKTTKLALVFGFVATPFFQAKASSQDFVSKTLQTCRSQDGTVIKEEVSKDIVDESKTKKVYKVCYDVLCYKATANMSEVNFSSIADFYENQSRGDRGAAIIAYDKNICTRSTISVDEGDIFGDGDADGDGDGDVSGSGSGSGSGSFVVRFNGGAYTCAAGQNILDCLRGHGVSIDGDVDIRTNGVDGDGRTIYVVRRRSGGDLDGDIGWDIDLDRGRGSSGYFYVEHNGRSYRCSASLSAKKCLKDRYGIVIDGSIDWENCAHCRGGRYSSRGSGGFAAGVNAIANLAGAIAPAYFMYKGVKVQANAYLGSNQAWANSQSEVARQCQIMQTNYMELRASHIQSQELPDQDFLPPECNGYYAGGFAGNQGWAGNGWGGWGNQWGSAGYSPNFMASMYGPYGNYMTGMNVTGMNFNPNMGLHMGGNLNLNSLFGLPPGGVNFGGSIGGGWGGNGGWGNGGWNNGGGWGGNGGWGNNGSMMCFRAPCPNTGGGWGGSVGGSWGVNTGGWANNGGGWNGSWNSTGNGTVPWNNGSGSYWNTGGGWGGNTGGGWNNNGGGGWGNSQNGNGWWAVQNSHFQSAQAADATGQFQQMGLQDSYNRAGYNLHNYGYAPYSPANVGFGINARFGIYP